MMPKNINEADITFINEVMKVSKILSDFMKPESPHADETLTNDDPIVPVRMSVKTEGGTEYNQIFDNDKQALAFEKAHTHDLFKSI